MFCYHLSPILTSTCTQTHHSPIKSSSLLYESAIIVLFYEPKLLLILLYNINNHFYLSPNYSDTTLQMNMLSFQLVYSLSFTLITAYITGRYYKSNYQNHQVKNFTIKPNKKAQIFTTTHPLKSQM